MSNVSFFNTSPKALPVNSSVTRIPPVAASNQMFPPSPMPPPSPAKCVHPGSSVSQSSMPSANLSQVPSSTSDKVGIGSSGFVSSMSYRDSHSVSPLKGSSLEGTSSFGMSHSAALPPLRPEELNAGDVEPVLNQYGYEDDRVQNDLLDEICSDIGIKDSMDLDFLDFDSSGNVIPTGRLRDFDDEPAANDFDPGFDQTISYGEFPSTQIAESLIASDTSKSQANTGTQSQQPTSLCPRPQSSQLQSTRDQVLQSIASPAKSDSQLSNLGHRAKSFTSTVKCSSVDSLLLDSTLNSVARDGNLRTPTARHGSFDTGYIKSTDEQFPGSPSVYSSSLPHSQAGSFSSSQPNSQPGSVDSLHSNSPLPDFDETLKAGSPLVDNQLTPVAQRSHNVIPPSPLAQRQRSEPGNSTPNLTVDSKNVGSSGVSNRGSSMASTSYGHTAGGENHRWASNDEQLSVKTEQPPSSSIQPAVVSQAHYAGKVASPFDQGYYSTGSSSGYTGSSQYASSSNLISPSLPVQEQAPRDKVLGYLANQNEKKGNAGIHQTNLPESRSHEKGPDVAGSVGLPHVSPSLSTSDSAANILVEQMKQHYARTEHNERQRALANKSRYQQNQMVDSYGRVVNNQQSFQKLPSKPAHAHKVDTYSPYARAQQTAPASTQSVGIAEAQNEMNVLNGQQQVHPAALPQTSPYTTNLPHQNFNHTNNQYAPSVPTPPSNAMPPNHINSSPVHHQTSHQFQNSKDPHLLNAQQTNQYHSDFNSNLPTCSPGYRNLNSNPNQPVVPVQTKQEPPFNSTSTDQGSFFTPSVEQDFSSNISNIVPAKQMPYNNSMNSEIARGYPANFNNNCPNPGTVEGNKLVSHCPMNCTGPCNHVQTQSDSTNRYTSQPDQQFQSSYPMNQNYQNKAALQPNQNSMPSHLQRPSQRNTLNQQGAYMTSNVMPNMKQTEGMQNQLPGPNAGAQPLHHPSQQVNLQADPRHVQAQQQSYEQQLPHHHPVQPGSQMFQNNYMPPGPRAHNSPVLPSGGPISNAPSGYNSGFRQNTPQGEFSSHPYMNSQPSAHGVPGNQQAHMNTVGGQEAPFGGSVPDVGHSYPTAAGQQLTPQQGFMQHIISDRSTAFRSHPIFPLLRDLIIADMNFYSPSFPFALIANLPSDMGRLLQNYLARNPPAAAAQNNANEAINDVIMDALKYAHRSIIGKIQMKKAKEGYKDTPNPLSAIEDFCERFDKVVKNTPTKGAYPDHAGMPGNRYMMPGAGHPASHHPMGNAYSIEPHEMHSLPTKEQQPPSKKHQVLPKESVSIMLEWLKEHQDNPYPNDDEKEMLIGQTKLTINQINYWFTNARRRILPKWALQRYMQQEQTSNQSESTTSVNSKTTTPSQSHPAVTTSTAPPAKT